MRNTSHPLHSLLPTIAAAAALAGCGGVNPPLISSGEQRDTAPQVSSADLSTLVAGNTTFAFNLFQQARTGASGNLFFSPYSISQAVAMVYAGAQGQTETQIAQALDFTLPQAQLHPALDSLDLTLHSRGQGAAGADGQSFQLDIVNALWGQTGFPFLGSYLDVLAVDYGTGVRVLDFAGNPEGSRDTINAWVSQQTDSLIPMLLPQGFITSATVFVLTDAIYFSGAWASPFDKAATAPAPFSPLAGPSTTVQMMSQLASYGYYQGNMYQAVELPYAAAGLAMTLIVPDSGQYQNIESSAGPALLEEVAGGLQTMQVELSLPKFQFSQAMDLKTSLEALGMTQAFTPAADFLGMTTVQPVWLSDAVHQAYVSVDESGTQAAAATAIGGVGSAAPVAQEKLVVDRPFLFLIRDIPTGTVLFLGRVLSP